MLRIPSLSQRVEDEPTDYSTPRTSYPHGILACSSSEVCRSLLIVYEKSALTTFLSPSIALWRVIHCLPSKLLTYATLAYLFLARLYPHTLLPASVYALVRAGSAALFSPWLGPYVDTAERLKVVRLSIGKRSPYLLHN